VVEHYKDKKKLVFKFKPKKHYKKTHGHRQAMTRFQVERVVYSNQKPLDEELDEQRQQ
jgi:ribosomal protein L21